MDRSCNKIVSFYTTSMKLLLSLTVFALLLSFQGMVQADIVIDRFDVANSGSVPRSFNNVNTYSVFTSTDVSILGGVRKWQVAVTKHGIAETEIYDVASGMYSVANGFGQNSQASIRWDSLNNNLMSGKFEKGFGGRHLDLSENGTNSLFSLDVAFADVTTNFEVVVTDTLGTFAVTKVVTSAQQTKFFFTEFLGIDFRDVHSIQLNISGHDAYDVGINHFAAIAIPEPLTAPFLSAALLGMFFARRRRR